MATLVLGFIFILLATFALVIYTTARSPLEQTIANRMALIHIPTANMDDAVKQEAEELLKATVKTRFGWLEEQLEQHKFAQRLRISILQANSSTTVAGLILTSVGLFVSGYCVTWFFAPVLLIDLGAGVGAACLPFFVLTYKRARRIAAFDAVLAECIDMLARALRAGHSLVSALETLSENAQEPAASEFGEVFRQQNLGLPVRDALLQLLDRVPSADLQVLVTALLVQKDTGGNLAEILDRTVFVIRERVRIQGEIRVQTAQGRLTGWILSALPVVMMIMLNLVNPGYSDILFKDPFGRKLLYYSLGMLLLGTLIIRRIVNGIEV
jgi:tight adherence protein B